MVKKFKIARLGSIFLLNIAVKELIDWLLNPILMINLGYVKSLIITTLLYIIIGIISVKLYDKKGEDLFGAEKYKRDKKVSCNSTLINSTLNFLKIFILGFILSLKNTGLVVIVFRKGSFLFNGFQGNPIKLIFLIYALFINIIWNIVIYFCSPFFVMVWEIIKEIFSFIFKMHYIIF